MSQDGKTSPQERPSGWSSNLPGGSVAARARFRSGALAGLDVLLAVTAAAAISALAMERGFYEPPVKVSVLRAIQLGVLAAFVLDRLLRLLLVSDRRTFLRENWVDFLVMGAAAVAVLAAEPLNLKDKESLVISAAAVYVVITQIYILAALLIRLAARHIRGVSGGIPPVWVMLGGFAAVILFGTGLLMLPKAVEPDQPFRFIDALFTATSANCLTGLNVRDTSRLTDFGKGVVLILIQLGGLGIIIFGTVFAALSGRALSRDETVPTAPAGAEDPARRIGRWAVFAVLATLGIEAIGAAMQYPMWRDYYQGLHEADKVTAPPAVGFIIFNCVFHSVSAFCNAGFSLGGNSLVPVRGCWPTIGVIAPLILLGGLGFPVLCDCARLVKASVNRLRGRSWPSPLLTLHSKIVLAATLVLIVGGAAALLVIEQQADRGRTFGAHSGDSDVSQDPMLAHLPTGERVREAFFQSVTSRTGGFHTVSLQHLSEGGKLVLCLLMLIGGAPGGTAGGMKVTTVAVILATAWCVLRRREKVQVFRRTIPEGFLRRAVILAALYLILVTTIALILCGSMGARRLASTGEEPTAMQLFFESASACGAAGLSCGVTESLSTVGKYAIIAGMFLGRLGPLALLAAMALPRRHERHSYPLEDALLG